MGCVGGIEMPISRDEFEKERKIDLREEMVVSFLEKNKDKAFTVREIASALGIPLLEESILNSFSNYFRFISILSRLENEGRIIKKRVDFEDFYSVPN